MEAKKKLKGINRELIINFNAFWSQLTRKEKGNFIRAYTHEFGCLDRTFFNRKKAQKYSPAEQKFITNYFTSEEYLWILDDIVSEKV